MGGTFDPIHLGHIHILKALAPQFDQLMLIPSGQPRLRLEKPQASGNDRLEMCIAALDDLPNDLQEKIVVNEVMVGGESGFEDKHRVVFNTPRTVDYRANVQDIAKYLLMLMNDAALRDKMGKAGRERVVENFDYRVVAKRFVQIMNDKLGIS